MTIQLLATFSSRVLVLWTLLVNLSLLKIAEKLPFIYHAPQPKMSAI